MTALKKLTFTDHTQKRAKVDPTMRSRGKFVAALQQQINIIEAQERGETFTVERMQWQTSEDGTRKRVPVQVEPRAWFWEEEGVTYLAPKIGVRPLEIEKGKPTIKVGAKKELVPTLKTLATATEAGELDSQISATAGRKATN